MFVRRLALALACLNSLSANAANAADTAAVKAIVDRALQPVIAQYGVPGMAVAVTVDGKTMFFNYGLAATTPARPVTEHTLFELGSISKTFTATLATHAEARGKLALDDHPGKYIAALKGSPLDHATLRELGTYTAAGLPLQVPDEVTNDAQMLAWLRAWQPNAAPGAQRRYSNPSIGLLGRATAVALKSDFGDALEQQLFPAFGLRHTYVRVPASAMLDYAWGHNASGKPVRVKPGVFDVESYGVKSSSADLIRYLQAQMEPAHLQEPLRSAVEGTQIGYYTVGGMVQGLGWEQYRGPLSLQRLLDGNSAGISQQANPVTRLAPALAPPGTFFNKTGSTGGFSAYAAFIPQRRIAIVMLANKSFPVPPRVTAAYAIIDQLAPFTQPEAASQ